MGHNTALLVLGLYLAVGVQSFRRKVKNSLSHEDSDLVEDGGWFGNSTSSSWFGGVIGGSQFRNGAKPPVADGDIVAIFADFDGCFDFLNPLLEDKHQNSPAFFQNNGVYRKYESERDKIIAGLRAITAGARKVILFVGSNRQCRRFDKILGDRTWGTDPIRHGFAALRDGAYDEIAKVVGNEVSGKPWEVNYALVTDNPNNKGAWTAEQMRGGSNDATGRAWKDDEVWQQRTTSEGNFKTKADEDELKWMIVQNNLKQLRGMGKVHTYFFDDRDRFLKYTGRKFDAEKASWGEQYAEIDFNTVKFDYMDYIIDRKDLPLLLESYAAAGDTAAAIVSSSWWPKSWGWS